jgi:excinuclease ABC subunit C
VEGAVVEGLFSRPIFVTFGPDGLFPTADPPPLVRVRARRPGRLRAHVRQHCPRQPGVYGMVDVRGELLYIGKAKCLRSRLLSYFRPKSRDAKAGRIIAQTRVLVWEPGTSEFAALLRELELIRRWQPRCNVQGQPRRRRRYVCLGRRPAPHVFLASRPPSTAIACFGPVPSGAEAREAVRRVNDGFGLRDCPQKQTMIFADQRELFPDSRAAGCIRHEIGTCLGPCAGACTRATYAERVQAARRFLAGEDDALLTEVQSAMQAASTTLAFERAAALRDKLTVLRWLCGHLDRLRQLRARPSSVYPVVGCDGVERWYLIHGGRVRTALVAPRQPEEKCAADRTMTATFREKVMATDPIPPGEIDGVLLVSAWFHRHPVGTA